MARVTSHEQDAAGPQAPLQTIAPAAPAQLGTVPLIALGDGEAGVCVDGVCRLPG